MIKTWRQRCEEHPDHNGIVSEGMIQARMQEEIDELRAALEQEPVAWVYQEGLEALKSGRPWTAYGSSGRGRIPLYLDAVAPKAEPRSGESGAGFESLPASPKWQGLTEDERARFRQLGFVGVEIVEATLKERNS